MPQALLKYNDIKSIIDELIKVKITISENARQIYNERYLKNNLNGKKQSVEERLASVAIDIASAQCLYTGGEYPEKLKASAQLAKKIYNQMIDKKFLFNTPTLMNFGRFKKKKEKIIKAAREDFLKGCKKNKRKKKDDDDDDNNNNNPTPPTFEEQIVGTYQFISATFNQPINIR